MSTDFIPPDTLNGTTSNPSSSRPSFSLLFSVLGLTLLVIALGYWALPVFDVYQLKNLLSVKLIWGLTLLLVGGTTYWYYFDYVKEKPWVLFIAFAVFYPLFIYTSSALAHAGLNLRGRILMLVGLCIPSFFISFSYWKTLFKKLPFFTGFIGFVTVLVTYYFFNNVNFSKPIASLSGTVGGGSYAFEKLFVMIVLAASVLLAGSVFLGRRQTPQMTTEKIFALFNKTLLIILFIYSVIAIITYPLNDVTTANIDGFKRTRLIFTHPNQYAHYMGFMVTYILGIYLYYKRQIAPMVSPKLIFGLGLVIAMGFLIGLSKTAIAIVLGTSGLLIVSSMVLDKKFKFNPLYLVVPGLVLLVALFGLKALGVIDIFQVIEARLESIDSLIWRFITWNRVISYVDTETFLFGHGLTAANARILQLTYNVYDAAKGVIASPHVHNIYVETFYDFGILGLTWLFGLIGFLVHLVFRIFHEKKSNAPSLPLCLLMFVLTLFFMMSCAFDEMFYSISYPYWYMITALYGQSLAVRHQVELTQHEVLA